MSPPVLIIFCVMLLLLLAAVVLVSAALLAASRPIVPWQRLRSALGLALWIVPALVILGALAANSQQRFSNRRVPTGGEIVQTASVEHNLPHLPVASERSQSVNVSWFGAALVLLLVVPAGLFALRRTAGLGRRWWSWWRLALCGMHTASGHKDVVVRAIRPPAMCSDSWRSAAKLGLSALVIAGTALFLLKFVALRTRQYVVNQRYETDRIVSESPDFTADSPSTLRRIARQSKEVPVELLKTRQTSSDTPQWPGEATQDRIGLQSKLYASVEEAEADVTAQALVRVQERFRDQSGLPGDWPVPVALVEQHGVKDLITEVVDHDFGEPIGKAKMYRAHLWLDYSAKLREALFDSWRAQLVEQRLISLGSIVALVTLMLGTAAGYFRLDDFTGGQHRGRLKFAAAAVIAAGSLVALVV